MMDGSLKNTRQWFQIVKETSVWSLPIKFLLGALLGALGGSSLLGVISEYATYYYAISYGVRPPMEGIPYLKASVTLISILLLISGAIIYCVTMMVFRSFARLGDLSNFFNKKINPLRRRRPVERSSADLRVVFEEKSSGIVLVVTVMAGFICFLLVRFLVSIAEPILVSYEYFEIVCIGYGIFAALAFLTFIRPGSIVWVSLLATISYFALWFVFLFTPLYYSSLLRFVGYGGGLPVVVDLKSAGPALSPLDTTLYLVIRTTDAVIVLNESTNQFIEIPNGEVRMIRHKTGGLNNLLSYLPDLNQQYDDQRRSD